MFYELMNQKNKDPSTIFYVNLTNGLECLQTLRTLNIEPRFVQIQSTRLEQCEYDSIIKELGADILMNLAVGNSCCVIDFGALKKNSKAIYKGVPLIKYICERAWFGDSDRPYILNRQNNSIKKYCDEEFNNIYNDLSRSTKRLLKKYKKYACLNNKKTVNIIGVSNKTIHDGDGEYYKNVVKYYLD